MARKTREPEAEPEVLLDYIAADLRPLAWEVEELTPHPDNARRHSDRDIPVLMESLTRYGQRKPVVGKREYRGLSNVIIAGNGTLSATRRLERSHLAVAWFDGTDDEADEYALVDNRTAELSEWDLQTLSRQLQTIKERGGDPAVARMGWASHEAAPLLAANWTPNAEHGTMPAREVTYRSVSFSLQQWMVVELALQRAAQHAGDASLPEGRCLELIAADYLGGPAAEPTS